jgi:hypothetical protein
MLIDFILFYVRILYRYFLFYFLIYFFLLHHFFHISIHSVEQFLDVFCLSCCATNHDSVSTVYFHLVSAGQPIHRGNTHEHPS